MREEEKTWLRRLGGHVVLLVVAVLLFVGWRTSLAGNGGASPIATADAAIAVLDATPLGTTPGAEGDLPPADGLGELPVISDSSLAPAPNPHTYQGQLPQHQFQTYVVERGDTPNGIAERFGIQPETLLGGNPWLSQESSLLQAGVELIILPIDGVLHDVQPGDTLEGVSAQYDIPVEQIVAYEANNLEFPFRLEPETQILVPGAVRELFVWTPPDLSSVLGRSSAEGGGVRPVIVGTGTYIFPVGSRNFTQFFWYGHPGLDIALAEGSPVYASDTGTVTFAGWNIYGFGNLIVVNHGNGAETFYGHLSGINVIPGQIVYQGNVIGTTGNTGRSSGPHIHFEIRINAVQDNPCWFIGC